MAGTSPAMTESMSPDLYFLLVLAVRMAVAAAFVIVGLDDHRALRPGDRRAGRDAADLGRPLLRVPRARPRCGVHRRRRAREPADQRRDHRDGTGLRGAGAAPRRAHQLPGRNCGLVRGRRAGDGGGMVAGRRHPVQCRRDGRLPAAGAALPRRQNAADRAALVRHPAARHAGRHARRDPGHAVGRGRPAHLGHHRAVSGGVQQPDADPAAAHRRARDRRRDRERPVGPDRLRHRDRGAASGRAARATRRWRSASRLRPASHGTSGCGSTGDTGEASALLRAP